LLPLLLLVWLLSSPRLLLFRVVVLVYGYVVVVVSVVVDVDVVVAPRSTPVVAVMDVMILGLVKWLLIRWLAWLWGLWYLLWF
jgi:hypothetical protein